MVYDERIYNFPTADRVSLLTLDGSVLVPFRFGTYADGMLQRRRGQCHLLYRNSSATFFLAVSGDAPEPTLVQPSENLGVCTLVPGTACAVLKLAPGPTH